ncbi:beta-glucuronidase [Flavobacterium sp. W4I14]|nr:beta-glucuronidase [Flavobacterium sp. W4I14]
MNYPKIRLIVCCILVLQTFMLNAQQKYGKISLNGEWRFSLDFTNTGLKRGWESNTYKSEGGWDKAQVPHSFSADGRYLFYEGTGWYRKQFVFNGMPADSRVLLHFDAVFNRSEIWLNGKKIGTHEGGYTPFEFEVTKGIIPGKNSLVVKANNHLDSLTIPTILSNPANAGNVGWVNYGGITRDVYLMIKPETYLKNVKIETAPNLAKGNSVLKIKTFIANTKDRDTTVKIGVRLFKDGKLVPAKFKSVPIEIAKNSNGSSITAVAIDAKNTELWSVDHPKLYRAEIVLGSDTQNVNFGIRKVEVKGAKLLVNGESVKYGGGNLVLDYPKFGSVVNDTIADKYLRLMKQGGMEFQRLSHYPLPETILDWADKNGMLIIAEAGNWGYGDREMDDPELKAVYKKQLQEMMEANWNHPSIIAYSVGNEFDSHHQSGINWAREMFSFIKTIDTSRLNTLVSNKLDRTNVVKPEDEASFYADFICSNIYSNYKGFEATVNKIQRIYPEKPILISEWGQRADQVKSEDDRSRYIREIMSLLRKSSNVVGCSWWSFNDYYSRYAGSNKDGFRPWGLVDYTFRPRSAYQAQQAELSPVIITKKSYLNNTLIIELSARSDFPSYTVKGYKLRFRDGSIDVPTLKPGQKQEMKLMLKGDPDTETLHLVKPTGFEVFHTLIQLK